MTEPKRLDRSSNVSATSLLLIDDDAEFLGLVKSYLEREGFRIATAQNGEDGITEAVSGRHALAVLDIMMPRMNGLDVLRRIRSCNTMPILMLTAKGDDADRVIGLELGADDYVTKPCTPRELTARVRAILRRTHSDSAGSNAAITVGPLTIWPKQRRVEWSQQVVRLTSTEFSLLEILARNAGTVVSKGDLSLLGLGRSLERFDRSVDVHLSSIRQKLGLLPDGRSIIQTVFRKGYLLIRD